MAQGSHRQPPCSLQDQCSAHRLLLPQLRRTLPASRYEIYLNFFNHGRDWAEWMASAALGPAVLAELHVYHAFDPPVDPANPLAASACPMCTAGPAAHVTHSPGLEARATPPA